MEMDSRMFAQKLVEHLLSQPQNNNDYAQVALQLQRYSGNAVKPKKIHYLRHNETTCHKWLLQALMIYAIKTGWQPGDAMTAQATIRTVADGEKIKGTLADYHQLAEGFLTHPMFDSCDLSESDYPSPEQVKDLVHECVRYEKAS
jgi:hypothetical protein